jgi:hypothetical protein
MRKTKPVSTDAKHVRNKQKQKPAVNPAERWTGHALDGSRQLDIVEEQMYANEPGPTIDQPLAPQKTPK